MLLLIYTFLKLIVMTTLSLLLILYFPARFLMACYFHIRNEKTEKLNNIGAHTYYALGSAILFLVIALFSSFKANVALCMILVLGLLGVIHEVANRNILSCNENVGFLKLFFVIFMLGFVQYIVHSVGHDEWQYFQLLRSYHVDSILPVKSIGDLLFQYMDCIFPPFMLFLLAVFHC